MEISHRPRIPCIVSVTFTVYSRFDFTFAMNILCFNQRCGYGGGGWAVCMKCQDGRFSQGGTQTFCKECLGCAALKRETEKACGPQHDTKCGVCLEGLVVSCPGWASLTKFPANSFDPERCSSFKCLIFEHMLRIKFMSSSWEIAFLWTPLITNTDTTISAMTFWYLCC